MLFRSEANGFVVDLEHPDFGRYRTTDVPFRMDRTPVRTTGPSPRLGADTTAVLTEAGLSPDSIDELARSGAETETVARVMGRYCGHGLEWHGFTITITPAHGDG